MDCAFLPYQTTRLKALQFVSHTPIHELMVVELPCKALAIGGKLGFSVLLNTSACRQVELGIKPQAFWLKGLWVKYLKLTWLNYIKTMLHVTLNLYLLFLCVSPPLSLSRSHSLTPALFLPLILSLAIPFSFSVNWMLSIFFIKRHAAFFWQEWQLALPGWGN